MKKSCYYTLKDILMGLKSEYENHIKELVQLKSYVLLNEGTNNLDNFYFWVYQGRELYKPEMFCTMIKKGFPMTIKIDELNIGKKNYPDFFNSPEFIEKYHIIMKSEFVRKMFGENIQNIDNNIEPALNIKQNSIEIINGYDKPNMIYKPYIDKYSNKVVNELIISLYTKSNKSNKMLTEKMIEHLFESKFWSHSFSGYQTKIIDNNLEDKPIVVYGSPIILDNNNVKYRIQEDEDYYILKKNLR